MACVKLEFLKKIVIEVKLCAEGLAEGLKLEEWFTEGTLNFFFHNTSEDDQAYPRGGYSPIHTK